MIFPGDRYYIDVTTPEGILFAIEYCKDMRSGIGSTAQDLVNSYRNIRGIVIRTAENNKLYMSDRLPRPEYKVIDPSGFSWKVLRELNE